MEDKALKEYNIQVMGSVDNNLIDIGQLADEIELALDNYMEKTYHMSKENLEDLHMCLGDDLFHDYLINLNTITDDKGLVYIKSFSKDHKPKSEKEKKTIRKEIHYTVENTLDEMLQKYYGAYGEHPEFIVMSEKTYKVLERQMADAYRGYIHLEHNSRGSSYKGIPFAIIPGKQDHFIQLVVFIKKFPALAKRFNPHIHQGNYQDKSTFKTANFNTYGQNTISKRNT